VKTHTDQELLRDYTVHRSEAAFTELARRHVDLVYSAALRMVHDPHLAEDVTQSVFLALARNSPRLANHPVLSGWLHRTTQNLGANAVRASVRRQAYEQEAAAMSELLAADTDASWDHVAPHLDAVLGELSDTDRDVVMLRYFERKSAREMAQRLGLSDEAAQKRVSRAVERLRELFLRRGVTVGASGLAVVVSANAVQSAPVGLVATISSAVAMCGTTALSTATATTLKLAIMSKLKVSAVSALVVAGLATPLVLQHQSMAHLRSENSALQEQARQADVLRGENDRLSAQLSGARQGPPTNVDTSELLRLRGEVGRLRPLESEVAKLREESHRHQSQVRKAMEDLAATQQGTLQFAVQRVTSIDALKQVGHQLRELAAANHLGAAFTADGKLNPGLIAGTHPDFDMGNVELALSDPSQLPKLLEEAPDIIVARTAEAIRTPDERWMRFYIQADGSVQNYSTPYSNQVFSSRWQLEHLNP
jgi:RNA polymerase sigma factor (sigma-70 family)